MALNVNHEAQKSQNSRFLHQRADSLNDIDSQVNQRPIQASPPPSRHLDRAAIAYYIATLHCSCYWATRQKGDLDQAIVGYAEALLHGFDNAFLNIITFKDLTDALTTRFKDFGAREDLDHIILYYRHLCTLSLDVAGIKRIDVLQNLAISLRFRFRVEGRLKDIEVSISLLRLVTTMILPGTDDYYLIVSNLAHAWREKYARTLEPEHLTEAISWYRAVLTSCSLDHPERRLNLNNLAISLISRFEDSRDINDIEDAITLLQGLLGLEDPNRMFYNWVPSVKMRRIDWGPVYMLM